MLSDEIDAFLAHGRVQGLSPATSAQYALRLERIRAWLHAKGHRRWVSVRPADLDAYMLGLAAAGLRKTTRRGSASTIREFCGWLAERGKVLVNPARDLPLPDDGELDLPPAPLSEEEVAQLFEALPRRSAADLRNRLHLELLYGCALRVSESLHLDVSDLDLRARTVHVRNGKMGKDRLMPMMRGVHTAAKDYLSVRRDLLTGPDHGALLLGPSGQRVVMVTFQQWLRRVGKGLGLRLHPHLLRHSIAVHLLRGGADIRHVQEFLGHACLETTKIYLRLVPAHLRRDYDQAMPEIAVQAASG
jgi:site-specific recombinase XerD